MAGDQIRFIAAAVASDARSRELWLLRRLYGSHSGAASNGVCPIVEGSLAGS
jgi:hypothetical protein